MSQPVDQLPEVQQAVLLILRSEACSMKRLAVSLKAGGVDCPELLPHLEALVALDFVVFEALTEDGRWYLTDKGKIAATLLWFAKHQSEATQLFKAMGGG